MSEVREKTTKEVSRRKFLQMAGVSLAGVTLSGGVGALLSANSSTEAAEVPAPSWPMEYKALDPDEAAKRGYDGYKAGG